MDTESDKSSDEAESSPYRWAADDQRLSRRTYRLCKPDESKLYSSGWVESPQNDIFHCDSILGLIQRKIKSSFNYYFPYELINQSPINNEAHLLSLCTPSPNVNSFEFVESIELRHMNNYIFAGKKEIGEGHLFEAILLNKPSWCDHCGHIIWGISKTCLQCKYEPKCLFNAVKKVMVEFPSFLQDELAAFEAIYSELVNDSQQTNTPCITPTPQPDSLSSTDIEILDNMNFMKKITGIGTVDENRNENRNDNRSFRSPSKSPSQSPSPESSLKKQSVIPVIRRSFNRNTHINTRNKTVNILNNSHETSNLFHDFDFTKINTMNNSDKLFLDLLDDLDCIAVNTPSAKRRKKARELFSDWLFNREQFATLSEKETKIKNRHSFSEYAILNDSGMGKTTPSKSNPNADRIRSHSLFKDLKFNNVDEDDADGGYHTGDHTILEKAKQLEKTAGYATLSREELKNKINAFNKNVFGLEINMVEEKSVRATPSRNVNKDDTFFQGFIRVYMNLMRPISMSTARPPSYIDALPNDSIHFDDSSTTSFYLPKDITKVIHISSDTSTQEVITVLLQKYKITDNPHKFALYERITGLDDHSSLRRITNAEFPLEVCLNWTSEGLHNHQFVLQENDTQEVLWDAFSVPELDNFLKILDREENEYVEQIKAKYNLLRIQLSHQVSTLQENESESRSSTLATNRISKPGEKTVRITNDGQEEVFV